MNLSLLLSSNFTFHPFIHSSVCLSFLPVCFPSLHFNVRPSIHSSLFVLSILPVFLPFSLVMLTKTCSSVSMWPPLMCFIIQMWRVNSKGRDLPCLFPWYSSSVSIHITLYMYFLFVVYAMFNLFLVCFKLMEKSLTLLRLISVCYKVIIFMVL